MFSSSSYKSLQGNMVSMCKSLFQNAGLKKIGEGNAEQKVARQQSENLKWQQEMFHKMVKAVGLLNEGIISQNEMLATKTHILDSLVASPPHPEHPSITRDKLLFLQELLFEKCISEDEYHLSKRPLLLRLAVQGVEIDSRDVVLGNYEKSALVTLRVEPRGTPISLQPSSGQHENGTVWSDVSFKDEECLLKETLRDTVHEKSKAPIKQVMNKMSLFSLTNHNKNAKLKGKQVSTAVPDSTDLYTTKQDISARQDLPQEKDKLPSLFMKPADSFGENPFWQPDEVAEESSMANPGHKRGAKRAKVKKAFNHLFHKIQAENSNVNDESESTLQCDSETDDEEQKLKEHKKGTWGLFNASNKHGNEEEFDEAPLNGSIEKRTPPKLVSNPMGMGPNTKTLKKKLNSKGSSTDFFLDKVLGENIKNELSRIRTAVGDNKTQRLTNEQIEQIANKLPVDKSELEKYFPKSWCDKYGDVVLGVVTREFKEHVDEMENVKRQNKVSAGWGGDDDMEANLLQTNNVENVKPKTPPKKTVKENTVRFLNQDENSDPNLSKSKYTSPSTGSSKQRKLFPKYSSPFTGSKAFGFSRIKDDCKSNHHEILSPRSILSEEEERPLACKLFTNAQSHEEELEWEPY